MIVVVGIGGVGAVVVTCVATAYSVGCWIGASGGDIIADGCDVDGIVGDGGVRYVDDDDGVGVAGDVDVGVVGVVGGVGIGDGIVVVVYRCVIVDDNDVDCVGYVIAGRICVCDMMVGFCR